MSILFIPYQQIDKAKWDNCIDNASNGLVYAYSFYLDTMSKNWDALVLNDYEAVMPLTWNKKYGIQYLYQPFFCASLGVFGNTLSGALVNDFLKAIPAKFKYWDIYLNAGNFFSTADFKLYERTNYTLALNDNYDTLYTNFRDNIKRNIKKCEQLNFSMKKNIDINKVIELAASQSKNFSPVSAEDYERFKKLYHHLQPLFKAVSYGIYSASDQLMASCVFFFSHNRAYYILVGNHPNGKTMGASHALINAFIKDHAGSGVLLDFEGSDINSLAFFYSGFGAVIEKYAAIKLNRLPFWLKWLKK